MLEILLGGSSEAAVYDAAAPQTPPQQQEQEQPVAPARMSDAGSVCSQHSSGSACSWSASDDLSSALDLDVDEDPLFLSHLVEYDFDLEQEEVGPGYLASFLTRADSFSSVTSTAPDTSSAELTSTSVDLTAQALHSGAQVSEDDLLEEFGAEEVPIC
jgi:hypothetical protein